MEDWRSCLPVYLRYFRYVMLYPVSLLVWSLCMLTMTSFFSKEVSLHVAAALFAPFIFFSVARVFAEHEEDNAKGFAEGEGFFARALAVLVSRHFLVQTAIVAGFLLLLPFEAGFYHVYLLFFAKKELSRAVIKLGVLAIGLPLWLVLLLLAQLSARQKAVDDKRGAPSPERRAPDMMMETVAHARWAAHSMGEDVGGVNPPTGTIDSAGRAFLRRSGQEKKHLLLSVLALCVIYAFGGFGIMAVTPIVISVWAILGAIGAVRWWLPLVLLAALIGGFWLWHVLRALRIRRRFLKGLKRTCREYGFRLEGMRRPYRSLFCYRDGINFTVLANGKRYDCKLFSAMRRHFEMFFDEGGKLHLQRSLRLRRVEFFRFSSIHEFDFESEGERICIVSPVPGVISAGNDRWNRPIDTGTRVGKYRIFSSTGFLNALRRDCVEKD